MNRRRRRGRTVAVPDFTPGRTLRPVPAGEEPRQPLEEVRPARRTVTSRLTAARPVARHDARPRIQGHVHHPRTTGGTAPRRRGQAGRRNRHVARRGFGEPVPSQQGEPGSILRPPLGLTRGRDVTPADRAVGTARVPLHGRAIPGRGSRPLAVARSEPDPLLELIQPRPPIRTTVARRSVQPAGRRQQVEVRPGCGRTTGTRFRRRGRGEVIRADRRDG